GVGEVLPGAAHALHVRLAAEHALGADLAGDARHLVCERRELVDHRVDRVRKGGDLARGLDGDLARQVAVVTSAMLRTWFDRLSARVFTFSVRPRQTPLTPSTFAWPPSRPSVPTSRATRVTSAANAFSWSTIVLIVSAS